MRPVPEWQAGIARVMDREVKTKPVIVKNVCGTYVVLVRIAFQCSGMVIRREDCGHRRVGIVGYLGSDAPR